MAAKGEVVAWARTPALAARLARALAPRLPKRLVRAKRTRTFLLDVRRVLTFELRSGLVHAYVEDGESYVVNGTIRALAARLAAADFFRAHRDTLVNLAHVWEVERDFRPGCLRLVLGPPSPAWSRARSG